MNHTYIKFQYECFECSNIFYDKQGLKKHIKNVHNVSKEESDVKVKKAKIIESEKENMIILNSKDENEKLKDKKVGDEFFDCEIGKFVKVCYGCPVENCEKKSKNYDNLMQHIRKTHNVKTKIARLYSKKAYKDIITIEDTNPTNNDKWELKPHSNENIDEENIPGKIVFQCPLLGCNSKLKHIPSVKDHLNKIHKIPRGKKMQDIATHAQKPFVESKDNKKVVLDKKRLIAIQERLAVKTESKLQKYKEAIKRIQKGEDEGLAKTKFKTLLAEKKKRKREEAEKKKQKTRKREQMRKNRDYKLLEDRRKRNNL